MNGGALLSRDTVRIDALPELMRRETDRQDLRRSALASATHAIASSQLARAETARVLGLVRLNREQRRVLTEARARALAVRSHRRFQ